MKFFNLPKKIWVPTLVVCAVILAFVIIFPIVYCVALKVDLKINASQVEQTQQINVEWDTSKPVDKITISVYHGGDLVSQKTTTKYYDIAKGNANVDAYYGKMTVEVEIKKGIYKTSETMRVNLSADEYNIAPITGTMSVSLFSLSLPEITDNGRIPTFVWLQRSGAWDWNELTENVYPMPIASTGELLGSEYQKMFTDTANYVKELYEVNNQSKFNLYYSDFFNYAYVQATIANGIPSENYHVVLLSDGSASFAFFNKHFNNENADAEYDKMVGKWTQLKKDVDKSRYYGRYTTGVINAYDLQDYSYVIASEEENIEWWLTRISGTLAPNNPDFYIKVENNSKIKVKDLGKLLSAIQNDQSENQYLSIDKLKKLYNFSEGMFEKAVTENKKVMVILGTWTETEIATNFDEYVKSVIAYYGDEYVYYYKGHPRNPTNSVNGKLEHLKSLGLIDVDSTIPAEFIFFFNPEAFCSGYASSTFDFLTPEKSCAIFGVNMEDCNETYKSKIDIFISVAPSKIGNLTNLSNSFLLEFADTTNYDIAIYNANRNNITYYKLDENNNYQEVK